MTSQRIIRRIVASTAAGIAVSAGWAVFAAAPTPAVSAYLAEHAAAEKAGATFRPITEISPGFSQAEAYRVQHALVDRRRHEGDRVVGYKGSLMSQKSLTDRGVKEPLTGALFASGIVKSGGVVSLCGYRRPIFEMKLGYIFIKPIAKKVASVGDLKILVSFVEPVVEIPDIAYRDDKTYGAVDMAAANISSAKFVRGAPSVAFDGLDALSVTMRRGDARVTTGLGRESLGDQWESLRTVVNLALAHGGRIDAGSLVLTGKIGDKGDIAPGAYTADYGPLGLVQFRVENCPTS